MELAALEAELDGIPHMGRIQGGHIYRHVRKHQPMRVLEIGTAHGVSAAYIAAGLEANGMGHLDTVDHVDAGYTNPSAPEVLERVALVDRVSLHRVADSSYTWWLKAKVEQQSDEQGNCEPLYDFCFLDGAHNWTIDGLAVILVEKLLRPGAWLLLDDLKWTYSAWDNLSGANPASEKSWPLSRAEMQEPHIQAIFELLVKQHASFTEFREQDDAWGWARKAPGEPRRYTLETSKPLSAVLANGARATWRIMSERRRARRPVRSGRPL